MKPHEIITEVVTQVAKLAKAGVTLEFLDQQAEQLVKLYGATPYNKGYKPAWASTPFPSTLCLSVNNCIAHGIPDKYELRNGDILKIDLGIKIDGQCGDSGLTIGIGEIQNKDERLIRMTLKALYAGIGAVKEGATIEDIARAIEKSALMHGYVTNQNLSGHAIGAEMHLRPSIPNFTYIRPDEERDKFLGQSLDYVLKAGDLLCIEPHMTYKDKYGVVNPKDGWSVWTRDNKNAAMFEHMVEVTKDGANILTRHIQNIYGNIYST